MQRFESIEESPSRHLELIMMMIMAAMIVILQNDVNHNNGDND